MVDTTTNSSNSRPYWLPDIQGFLALGILLFVFLAFVVLIYGPSGTIKGEVLSVVTVVIGVLTGSLKDVYSYFFPGSKDITGNSDAIRQIAMAPLPSAAPITVVSWWSLLTAPEQSAIEAAAPADTRIAAILTALKTGKAEAPDLVDLVAKGLLTQARADMLKGT